MEKKPLFNFQNLKIPKKTVTCDIPQQIEEVLFMSAHHSGRSRKKEAEMRLEDHIRRFSSIESVGNATERDESNHLE